jgi:hypothetical protein
MCSSIAFVRLALLLGGNLEQLLGSKNLAASKLPKRVLQATKI